VTLEAKKLKEQQEAILSLGKLDCIGEQDELKSLLHQVKQPAEVPERSDLGTDVDTLVVKQEVSES
jgi:hypothetical protein